MKNTLAALFTGLGIVLTTTVGFGQGLPQPAAGNPPARHWVLSSGPFHPLGGLIPNVRAERLVGPHVSVLLDGAFWRQTAIFANHRYTSTGGSLAAGVRYYPGRQAPKGFYAEALFGSQYKEYDVSERGTYTAVLLRPELGVGYQFLFGKRRRIALDLGARTYCDYYLRPANIPRQYQANFTVMPAVRVGIAF